MKILKRITDIIRSFRYYVIADPYDNSITLSKGLFDHIKKHSGKGNVPCVFVFQIKEKRSFGFMVNPNIEEKTQLCEIQYNDKYKCIGFETLCPSVGKIFYEYGLPHDKKCKLSVCVRRTGTDKIYYEFDVPNLKQIKNAKHTRKYEKKRHHI